ncbi:MAG: response regulator [Deltaproteobacteria bacterium]|nr:response regulator [Deltaproteobacteria bacterium]
MHDISDAQKGVSRVEHLEHIIQSSDAIVHDMNNQLTSILAMSDLLMRTSRNVPSVSDGLQRILESARELSELAAKWQLLLDDDDDSEARSPEGRKQIAPISHEFSKVKAEMNKPRHILLIDDEEVVCEATAEMLKRLNYRVTSTMSGTEGIAVYRENHRDIGLVILDMMMPEMDGWQVFDALHKINADVDVLVSSGYSQNDAARTLLDIGVRGYLQKPFRINELSRIVNEILPAPTAPEEETEHASQRTD